jgi:hypothetical protein
MRVFKIADCDLKEAKGSEESVTWTFKVAICDLEARPHGWSTIIERHLMLHSATSKFTVN